MRFLTAAGIVAGLTVAAVHAIPTISVKGSKFFTSDGNQFFVKGIAYQLLPDDPLIDNNQCKLDASLMKTLGANSIRVYHVDPAADHDGCMSTFADAGIYLWLDLDTFNTMILQDYPQWNTTQLEAFEAVFDAFQKYDNLAGYFVGNEVINLKTGSVAAPYVKAAARDIKAYRNSKGYRDIPVGYSAADIAELRPMLQNYLACGSNASESIDFFALNAYEWCGDSDYKLSGYSKLTDWVTNYSIPIFFSETGCNTHRPRTFADQAAIFGPEMAPYWSGSIVYEWIQEMNDYGLISYGPRVDPSAPSAPPDGFPRSGTPTPVSPDFTNLQSQWATITPSGVSIDAYNPTLTPPPCPAFTSGVWNVNGDVALPTLGQTFDAAVASSITAGTAAATASATASNRQSGSASGTATGAAASGSSTGAASPARELRGGAIGLGAVMMGFIWWL